MVLRNRLRGMGFANLVGCIVLASLFARISTADDLRALIVGGGPNPENNQIAIESNVRYVLRSLPKSTSTRVLFASGDRADNCVLYESQMQKLTPEQALVDLLLHGRDSSHRFTLKYRAPQVDHIDGPSKKETFASEIGGLCSKSTTTPLLMYFTGHGSPNRRGNLDNNAYDLWKGPDLTVVDLASEIDRLPPEQPVQLVMVQCFSGAFGNLLFEKGDPKGNWIDRDLVGFYAAVKERPAAGCTPAVDEKEYHDFTSYFFAALTGKDRVGRRVRGADYDKDGKVSMHEAYCYALANDASIDVPVCTTDVFLRRYVDMKDPEIFQAGYGEVLSWATPAQRAALEALSKSCELSGDDRAAAAYAKFTGSGSGTVSKTSFGAQQKFQRELQDAKKLLTTRWPEIVSAKGDRLKDLTEEAARGLKQDMENKRFDALYDADSKLDKAQEEDYQREITSAKTVRFVRLFKSVYLAHRLREIGDDATKNRFERLVKGESRRLFETDRRAQSIAPEH